VVKFNGAPVLNLRQLAELAIACKEPFMRFDMEYNEVRGLACPLASAPALWPSPPAWPWPGLGWAGLDWPSAGRRCWGSHPLAPPL
jgi:hypothetical protein